MAYIGRDTDKLSNVEVLDNITFNGSSSYTLQKGGSNFTPSSANTILLSIDGVVQAGNFTVSGSTIDFGVAIAGTSTCDFILHYGVGLITAPSDGTVTTAKLADSSVTTAKLNDASVSLAKLTATGTKDATTFLRGDNTFAEAGGGIEMADQWRLSQNLGFSTGEQTITAYWEQVDSDGFATIGSSMTQSSGIFTFPTTGIYLITAQTVATNFGNRNYQGHQIHVTLNNSTYSSASESNGSSENGGVGGYYVSTFSDFILDVTDTSNVKVKLIYNSNGSGTIQGNTTNTLTGIKFIRLGDT